MASSAPVRFISIVEVYRFDNHMLQLKIGVTICLLTLGMHAHASGYCSWVCMYSTVTHFWSILILKILSLF